MAVSKNQGPFLGVLHESVHYLRARVVEPPVSLFHPAVQPQEMWQHLLDFISSPVSFNRVHSIGVYIRASDLWKGPVGAESLYDFEPGIGRSQTRLRVSCFKAEARCTCCLCSSSGAPSSSFVCPVRGENCGQATSSRVKKPEPGR